MRAGAAAASLLVLLLTAAVPVAADPKLQAGCSQSAQSLAEMIACMEAGLPSAPPGSTAMDLECATAHRGPFMAPAEGRTVLRFGEKAQYGTVSKGVVLEAQFGAPVRAPRAGTVVFAGEFRAYGNLVILDVACDLRFLLAGASILSVKAGEAVTTGQTVGAMSAAKADSLGGPVIYVELRKSGNQIDPGPSIAGP